MIILYRRKALWLTTLALVLCLSVALVQTGVAQENTTDMIVQVDGEVVERVEPLYLIDNRVFAPVRFISEMLGAEVDWHTETQQLEVNTSHGDQLIFTINSKIMSLNGIEYLLDVAPISRNYRTYLPLRHVSELLHTEVQWLGEENTINLTKIPLHVVEEEETLKGLSEELNIDLGLLRKSNQLPSHSIEVGQELKTVTPMVIENKLDEDVLDLLARIIYLEAGDEPFEGQVAVGNVIMNRVESSNFPDSIEEVIFQPGQFTPVTTGKIEHAVASETAYLAAREVLGGKDYAGDALYFYNPSISNNAFLRSREVVVNIGNHRFAK